MITTEEDERLAILWDVDGVLNPDGKPTRRPEGYDTFRVMPTGWEAHKPPARRKPLRIWLNREHGPMITKFAAELNAENMWATTWTEDANRLISPELGLPEWRTLLTGIQINFTEWKWKGVLSELPTRPLIWLDDDMEHTWNSQSRTAFLDARGDAPTLLHHIESRIGLRQSDLDAARAWAASNNLIPEGQ